MNKPFVVLVVACAFALCFAAAAAAAAADSNPFIPQISPTEFDNLIARIQSPLAEITKLHTGKLLFDLPSSDVTRCTLAISSKLKKECASFTALKTIDSVTSFCSGCAANLKEVVELGLDCMKNIDNRVVRFAAVNTLTKVLATYDVACAVNAAGEYCYPKMFVMKDIVANGSLNSLTTSFLDQIVCTECSKIVLRAFSKVVAGEALASTLDYLCTKDINDKYCVIEVPKAAIFGSSNPPKFDLSVAANTSEIRDSLCKGRCFQRILPYLPSRLQNIVGPAVELMCSTGPGGKSCAQIALDAPNTFQDVKSKCSVPFSGKDLCEGDCKTAITQVTTDFGCCIQPVLRIFGESKFSQAISSGYWRAGTCEARGAIAEWATGCSGNAASTGDSCTGIRARTKEFTIYNLNCSVVSEDSEFQSRLTADIEINTGLGACRATVSSMRCVGQGNGVSEGIAVTVSVNPSTEDEATSFDKTRPETMAMSQVAAVPAYAVNPFSPVTAAPDPVEESAAMNLAGSSLIVLVVALFAALF